MTTTQTEPPPLAAFSMRNAEEVTPPGYVKQGDTLEGGVTIADLAFKGYVKVWDNRTGVMSLQPRWLLWQTATLKRPDGSYIFTDRDPHIPLDYGQDLVCLLHPASPDSARLLSMGFKPCLKIHTPNKAVLDRHMVKKHKVAYLALEKFTTAKEKAEDRELQRQAIASNQEMIRALSGRAVETQPQATAGPSMPAVGIPEAPLYVSDKPARPRTTRRRRG